MTTQGSTARAWALGGMVFAAAMMVMVGIWQILAGIAAIAKDEFFVVAPNYTYEIDTTTWGWIHLVLGVIVTATGIALFTGAMWARAVGIGLAVLSAIANFLYLPYYPLWAIVIIAANVFVIWSLANAGPGRPFSDVAAGDLPGYAGTGARTQEGDWSTESRQSRQDRPTSTP
jgi:hypothetical protein